MPAHWILGSDCCPADWESFEACYDSVLQQDTSPFRAAQLVESRVLGALNAGRSVPVALQFPIPIGISDVFDQLPRLSTSAPIGRRHSLPTFEMTREFTALVEQGALLPSVSVDAWSPLFTIDQADKVRLIFDLRALNESVSDPSFAMETLAQVPSFASGARVMLKLDLRSGSSPSRHASDRSQSARIPA